MYQHIIDDILERASTPAVRQNFKSTCNTMRLYENQTGKDTDFWDREDIIALINNQKFLDPRSAFALLTIMRKYFEQTGHAELVDNFDVSDFDFETPIREQLVGTLDELYSRLYQRYAPQDGDRIFPLASFAWMGLKLKDALSLLKSDVDLENGIIKTNQDLNFDVMPHRMCLELQTYADVKIVKRANHKIEYPDQRPEFIYKTTPANSSRAGKPIRATSAAEIFKNVCDDYNKMHTQQINMTYTSVLRSGQFFSFVLMEQKRPIFETDQGLQIIKKKFSIQTNLDAERVLYSYRLYKKVFNYR